MDLVDCFYHQFIFFADYDIMVGFKLGDQVFDDPGVDLVAVGDGAYSKSFKNDRHESRIDRRMKHADKFSG